MRVSRDEGPERERRAEENRMQQVSENTGQATTFKYGDGDTRVSKFGNNGETMYVNEWYVASLGRNTKHVFAGTARIATKLENPPASNPPSTVETFQYFYHSDHLGTTAAVTDRVGQVWQNITYFPFGEEWMQEGTNNSTIPYRFTGKEFDEETRLSYFGARYYDPRTSVWQSPDPILNSYLDGKPNDGVFNSRTLSFYAFTMQNPVVLRDPNGACVQDALCEGSWQPSNAAFSQFQDPEGVQDMLNFGPPGSIYVADPQVWSMDRQIDIGTQIQDSIRTENGRGRMRPFYDQASESPGTPVDFVMENIAMNDDPFGASGTSAWPFGRVRGTATGTITAGANGTYTVSGTLSILPDNYSWELDGDTVLGNLGILILRQGSNGPNRGDMTSGWFGTYAVGWDRRVRGVPGTPGRVGWSDEPNGRLPVQYPRAYRFEGHGSEQ